MNLPLDALRFENSADVYKAGALAGRLTRQTGGLVEFDYDERYRSAPTAVPVASTLPLGEGAVVTSGGALPPFFAGLLPEGRRLTVLRSAVKTSLDDELTLLLAVGADVPGDVQVVPSGVVPTEPAALADVAALEELEFSELLEAVDRHALPGVQDKVSSAMISAPVAFGDGRFLLKLDPPDYPRLTANEAIHLRAAESLGLPVARSRIVHDRIGAPGLLVRRFDRVTDDDGGVGRLPLEDATQVLGVPPADKYRLSSEEVVAALSGRCRAPLVAGRNLYLQFLFAWLTGNGDLHGKNVSVLTGVDGETAIAPVYDVPCTLVYGDDSLALPVAGKTRKLSRRHWDEFAESIGLPTRAAASAQAVALRAAEGVDLDALGLEGSPLRGAQRELRMRRAALE